MAPVPVVVPAATKVLLVVVALSNPGINETIRRTRGLVSIASDQTAAPEDQNGAFGAMVINDLAVAAGAASIPGPVTDANDDGWFLWVPFVRSFPAVNGIESREYQFDSKAMRRVEEGFAIAFMVENASATDGFNIACGISLLSSLS